MRNDALWIFGYGSLMWKPGFEFAERRTARLDGFKRCFGMYSEHYRGTSSRPGLVLGLDWAPQSSCTGVAFRICPTHEMQVRDYVTERELVSYAYFETRYPVTLLCEGDGQGENVHALCYVLDRSHRQYAGGMTQEQQAEMIAQARGLMGPNHEYLSNTLAKLAELGVEDPELSLLAGKVASVRSAQQDA